MASLTEQQTQTLSAICGRLVPTDDSGPGAVDVGAPCYIQRALESDYASLLPLYQRGLQKLDERARARHGEEFARLDGCAQDPLLREVESGSEGDELRLFFETIRSHTVEGMFGDPSWGGNRDQSGWKLIGYRAPRLTWSKADQEITPLPEPGRSGTELEEVG